MALQTQFPYCHYCGRNRVSRQCVELHTLVTSTITARLQLNEGKPLSVTVVLRDALREGGVAQLYRGAVPELTGTFRTRNIRHPPRP